MDEHAASSAIIWLGRILGPHPSDPGSSPGGGMFTRHARCCQSDRAAGTLLQVAALKNTRLDSTRRRASCLCLAAWLASQPERRAAAPLSRAAALTPHQSGTKLLLPVTVPTVQYKAVVMSRRCDSPSTCQRWGGCCWELRAQRNVS